LQLRLTEGASVTFDGTNCVEYGTKALLLSGYIRFVYGNYSLSDLENPVDAPRN